MWGPGAIWGVINPHVVWISDNKGLMRAGWVIGPHCEPVYFELCESQNRDSNAAKKMAPLRNEQMDSWACHHLRNQVFGFPPSIPPSIPLWGEREQYSPILLPMSLMEINEIMILKLLAPWCKLMYKSKEI